MSNRPAESAALAAAVAALLAYFLGIDDPTILVALLVVIGALPGVVTWCVESFRRPKRRKHGNPKG